MNFRYLEKFRSKLRSLTLTDADKSSLDIADQLSRYERWRENRRQDEKNKNISLKNAPCWSVQKAQSSKIKKKSDKQGDKNISSLHSDAEAKREAKMVFAMTSKSQPSAKMEKKNTEKKVKKLKTRDSKLTHESVKQMWDDTEGSEEIRKARNSMVLEKREGEPTKKNSYKRVLEKVKESKPNRVPKSCDCGKTVDVTVFVKDLCLCEKVNGDKIDVRKLYADYRKRKPKTAPHLTDSLIVHRERYSRKTDCHDKAEDEAKESPSKKEGKGVSFCKDLVMNKGKNEESLITLFKNSTQMKSACGLTKEQFEKIKSCSQKVNLVKGKIL